MGFYWKDRKINCKEAIENILTTIKILQAFDSQLGEAKFVKGSKLIEINLTSENVYEQLMALMYDSDAWYFHPNNVKDQNISLDAYCDSGFNAQIIFDYLDSTLGASFHAGFHKIVNEKGFVYGDAIPNSVILELPEIDEFYRFEKIKKLFDMLVVFWQPQVAWVNSKEFRKEVGIDETLVGWMNFFSDKRILQVVKESIPYEETKCGVFTYLSKNLIHHTDKSLVSLAKKIQQTLTDNNLIRWKSNLP